ncbi:hydroxymethylglutaryl-CoA lyase [Solimonas sp. K1W22B-7]|uniref:hydroxymethylglutaryl-CoA lyase n=1 Tax=Solimonas sp. K1W22B-7 TaxID=2303331 RepID=UPI000E32E34D|nr:hydroxymethylglutaryl-CoA lyase [Solimonas sp. K1W22B-7]AXQ30646.1 hydroxymethylglutaryl-CoA lyase [Solimonas sp. K1W22B-7]
MPASALPPPAVQLIDVAPRDGLQNEKVDVDTATKLALIQALLGTGLRRIEVASFVNPKRVPQMADAEAICAALPAVADARYAGLVLNAAGYERAKATGRLQDLNMVVCATDSFGQRNQGQTIAQGIEVVSAMARQARRDGLSAAVTVSVAFGCPFEGEVTVARVAEIAEALAAAEPDEIILADTIGVAVPTQVRATIAAVRERVGDAIPLRGHFHNTRNTAVANVLAAYEAGVRRFDASVGGIGGCPFAPAATGNVATEDLLYLFQRMGVDCGVDLAKLNEVARWMGEKLGRQLPGMVSRAGVFPPRFGDA